MAAVTRLFSSGLTYLVLLMVAETVATETLARLATSVIVVIGSNSPRRCAHQGPRGALTIVGAARGDPGTATVL